MARRGLFGSNASLGGRRRGADVDGVWATWMKFAPWWRRQRSADFTSDHADRCAMVRIRTRHRRKQRLSIGVARTGKNLCGPAQLSHASKIHDPDAGAEMFHQ